MRRLIVVLLLAALAGLATYAVSPLLAAWEIHAAARTGDRDVLERRVDWPAVRASLKRSAAQSAQVLVEIADVSGEGGSTLWQRIKAAATPLVAEPLIDRYVTAEGTPRLFQWRRTWQQRVRPRLGLEEPVSALDGTWLAGTRIDKVWTVWRRVEHVRLAGLGRVSIEIRDRVVERRRWRAELLLDDWTWRLVGLEVVQLAQAAGGAGR